MKGNETMSEYFGLDIFATKGIEYLVVIGYLLILVPFGFVLSRAGVVPALAKTAAGLGRAVRSWFRTPEGYHFHPGHSWAVPDGEDILKVGMDDFAQKLLGKLDAVILPEPGSRVESGEAGWQVDVDSRQFNMLCPVRGEVVAVNEELLKSPHLISDDPYGRGWLMKVRVPRMRPALRNLLSGSLAGVWVDDTMNGLQQRMSGSLGVVLQDGGLPVSGFARELSPDAWDEVVAEFLLTSE
jgi:glycine cleavage system H lipoate-binding protein